MLDSNEVKIDLDSQAHGKYKFLHLFGNQGFLKLLYPTETRCLSGCDSRTTVQTITSTGHPSQSIILWLIRYINVLICQQRSSQRLRGGGRSRKGAESCLKQGLTCMVLQYGNGLLCDLMEPVFSRPQAYSQSYNGSLIYIRECTVQQAASARPGR